MKKVLYVVLKVYIDEQVKKVYTSEVFLDSSMAEHSAVNRRVVGSSPTRGVKKRKPAMNKLPFSNVWLLGQAVKTSPFHGGNTGSIPVGVIMIFG